MPNCTKCDHEPIWHINSSGPHKRPCIKPGCKCLEMGK